MLYSPTDIMRQFLFVRESSQNKGNRVEGIQKWCGGLSGQSWCCYMTTMALDICFQGNSPIPRLGACQDVYELAKKEGWIVTNPKKDDIFLYVDDNDRAHHIGIVTIDGGKTGIAGNTSPDGKSSNGNGQYEHEISTNPKTVKYIRFPR